MCGPSACQGQRLMPRVLPWAVALCPCLCVSRKAHSKGFVFPFLKITFRCHVASTFLPACQKPHTFCSYSTGSWKTLDYILCNRNLDTQAIHHNAECLFLGGAKRDHSPNGILIKGWFSKEVYQNHMYLTGWQSDGDTARARFRRDPELKLKE